LGQAVLRECLGDDGVEGVLAIGRSSTGRTHPKLREVIRKDLFDLSLAEADVQQYDACFFCLGVSSAATCPSGSAARGTPRRIDTALA
jgi:hypothetical protein